MAVQNNRQKYRKQLKLIRNLPLISIMLSACVIITSPAYAGYNEWYKNITIKNHIFGVISYQPQFKSASGGINGYLGGHVERHGICGFASYDITRGKTEDLTVTHYEHIRSWRIGYSYTYKNTNIILATGSTRKSTYIQESWSHKYGKVTSLTLIYNLSPKITSVMGEIRQHDDVIIPQVATY